MDGDPADLLIGQPGICPGPAAGAGNSAVSGASRPASSLWVAA